MHDHTPAFGSHAGKYKGGHWGGGGRDPFWARAGVAGSVRITGAA